MRRWRRGRWTLLWWTSSRRGTGSRRPRSTHGRGPRGGPRRGQPARQGRAGILLGPIVARLRRTHPIPGRCARRGAWQQQRRRRLLVPAAQARLRPPGVRAVGRPSMLRAAAGPCTNLRRLGMRGRERPSRQPRSLVTDRGPGTTGPGIRWRRHQDTPVIRRRSRRRMIRTIAAMYLMLATAVTMSGCTATTAPDVEGIGALSGVSEAAQLALAPDGDLLLHLWCRHPRGAPGWRGDRCSSMRARSSTTSSITSRGRETCPVFRGGRISRSFREMR